MVPSALTAFQGQDIITALIHDLLGDAALAVERVGGHDGSFQRQHSFGTAVISLDLASVAICASTRRCLQPQALTMCRAICHSSDRTSAAAPSHRLPQHLPTAWRGLPRPLECSADCPDPVAGTAG